MKKAIVVLTRGYNIISKYKNLIKRNVCIAKNLTDKSYVDIIIFHEGNISLEQQEYIKQFTPRLNITFSDVSINNKAFIKNKANLIVYKPTSSFSLGYRHMCSFWFVNFWDFCDNYDLIIRIDEDCYIECDIMNIFNMLETKVSVYGNWDQDQDFVTRNLNKFTLNFLKKNTDNNTEYQPRDPSGPYTNLIGLNLTKLRENELLKKYINKVRYSNGIYLFRWGDLPLWGEALCYFYNKDDHFLSSDIKYYHESHNKKVN